MNWFTVGWILWLVWFVVEEGLAFATHGAYSTLSAHVWDWFSTKRNSNVSVNQSGWTRARHAALVMFLAWLSVHFVTGGWA